MRSPHLSAPAAYPARRLSRRQFCRVSALGGGALLVAVQCPLVAGAARHGADPDRRAFVPNAFVRIDPGGRITLTVARPEIGQGVRTSLPMMLAEELDADLSAVRIEQAGIDHAVYGDQYAGGSQSVRNGWSPLRQAGALARTLLLTAAAQRWGVDAATCHTAHGVVQHPPSGRRATYGELAAQAARLPLPEKVTLKEARDYTLIGRATAQLATPALVAGREPFGLDTRIPGMRFASIERAPVLGARLVSIDERAAHAVRGVTHVVSLEAAGLSGFGDNNPPPANGVAVVATSTWAALQGRRALQLGWSEGAAEEDSERRRAECARLAAQAPERVVRNDGNFEAAFAAGAQRLEAVYELPLLAHAPMEPMNCVAEVRDGRCEVWAPTQNPQTAREVAAAVAGVPLQAVTLNVVRSGGGFGRRFYADFVAEAVYLARRIGAPVQVMWTREDDTRHGFFRPASYHRMRAALDGAGRPVAWSQHLVNAQRGEFLNWALPAGVAVLPAGDELGPFDFPAGCIPNLQLAATALRGCPVPLGQWRSVEDSSNVFVYQSFIDELAQLAGIDPLAYRLALIGDTRSLPYYSRSYEPQRLRRVLERVAREAQWGEPLPRGSGRGIAASYANSAYVAVVAQVEIGSQGALGVQRLVLAADLGTVVNPLGAAAQLEGGAVFALSAALKQEITLTGGRVQQGNFDTFPVLRMGEAPRIEVHFVAGGDVPLGAGETAVPPTAPALANAVFAASGVRVRRLPLRAADLAARA